MRTPRARREPGAGAEGHGGGNARAVRRYLAHARRSAHDLSWKPLASMRLMRAMDAPLRLCAPTALQRVPRDQRHACGRVWQLPVQPAPLRAYPNCCSCSCAAGRVLAAIPSPSSACELVSCSARRTRRAADRTARECACGAPGASAVRSCQRDIGVNSARFRFACRIGPSRRESWQIECRLGGSLYTRCTHARQLRATHRETPRPHKRRQRRTHNMHLRNVR